MAGNGSERRTWARGFFDQPHSGVRTAARQIDEAIVEAATDSTAAAGGVTSS
jgi:hypothetical protein